MIYLDGVEVISLSKGVTWSFKFRLERIGDVSSKGLSGRAGEASSLVADKPIWYLGLGNMRSGESAGTLGFRCKLTSPRRVFSRRAP